MKSGKFFLVPVLAAGLLIAAGCGKSYDNMNATILPTNSPQTISESGTATLTFTASVNYVHTMTDELTTVKDFRQVGVKCTVKATGGTVSPTSVTTDRNGGISVVFTADNPKTFTGGTVTVTPVSITDDGDEVAPGTLTPGTATVLPLEGGGLIQKAQELDDNTYVIQKKGGNPVTAPLSLDDSQWYVGRSSMDKTQQALKLNIMDEDPKLSTMGWGMIELPEEIANKLTTINEEFYSKYPWAAVKFGTMRTGNDITVHLGQGKRPAPAATAVSTSSCSPSFSTVKSGTALLAHLFPTESTPSMAMRS